MSRRLPPPALPLLACLALACAGSDLPEGTVAVNMYDNGYSPPRVRIPVGGRVLFRNLGRNQHHAVALDETWSTEASHGSLVMERGEVAEVVFDEPGVYPYYCTYHGSPKGDRGMVGVVLVGDVEYRPQDSAHEPTAVASGRRLRVPRDYPRIQSAVDAARPGDLVLVDRGVYTETVRITTPSIVLRGVDRNESILDGDFLFGNGVLVLADGVAVENLTARNYTLNGFYWTGVTGFRGSYLTAHNNGDYGLYVFDSSDGLIEHSYASGSPDAGFYVGQCHPCRTVIRDVISEGNALGYSGTNAGGDLYLLRSVWRDNMAGIVPNTLDTELLPPQRETTIVANRIVANRNRSAPAKPIAWPAFGTGVLIAGGRDNVVERNVISDHLYGVLVVPSVDERFWTAAGNLVRRNRLSGSSRADLAVAAPGTANNCFVGNEFEAAAPAGIEGVAGCGALGSLAANTVPAVRGLLAQRAAARGRYPRGDYRRRPWPPPQARMPGGAEAPVEPAVEVFAGLELDLASLEPPPPTRLASPQPALGAGRPLERFVVPLAPLALLVAWSLAALTDLVRRREMAATRRVVWIGLVAVLPGLGAAVYLLAGGSSLSARLRWALVVGGALLYAGVLFAALGPAPG